MRSVRVALAAAVAFTGAAATLTTAGAGAGQDPRCTGATRDVGHGWSALRPTFPEGPARVQQVAALTYAPDRMYATNGTSIVATADAGCHWSPVLPPDPGGRLGLLPEPLDGLLSVPATQRHITAISAPSSATTSTYLYVAFDDESDAASQPRVAYFDGQGWHLAGGLPRFGDIREISAVDNNPRTVYAVIDAHGVASSGGLYASANGGADFVQRNAAESSSTLRDLQADPAWDTVVYGLGPHGLRVSRDGGEHFTAGPRPSDDTDSFDVSPGSGSERLALGHARRAAYEISSNAGLSFTTVQSPVAAKEVALQPLLDRVAVSDGKQVWLEVDGNRANADNVTPDGGAPQQLQLSAPSAAGYALVGLRDGMILRLVESLDDRPGVSAPGGAPLLLQPQSPPKQFPSTLLPGRKAVQLRAGAHRDVGYQLLLPRTPSPVDVMFLVDTSDSTEPTIDGLKQDLATIVNDLADVGLNAQFGVADFKDYSPTVADLGDGEIGDYAYRLDRRIGPVDPSLRHALASLHASGGGDPAESQLTALFQSTTGAGQLYPGRHTYIKGLQPGQEAGYRAGSLRLAVLATDDHFHRERDYLTPSWDRTIAALQAQHVHPVGLAMESIEETKTGVGPAQQKSYVSRGFRSLHVEQQLATDTGTFAPAGGLDCNGDLVPDVPAGAPFVCKVPATFSHAVNVGPVQSAARPEPVKLASAISRAAETLADMQSVDLRVRGARGGLARVVRPARPPLVNVRNDNSLGYTVRYTCPRLRRAQTYDLHVDALAGSRVVASAPMRVACNPVPKKTSHVIPPAAAVAVVVAPAAPAPPPPAPGNPLPNPNPNPNPGLNANVGFASQQEEQRQLAFAGADVGGEPDVVPDEMAMSRLGREPDPFVAPADDGGPQAWMFGVAAMMLTGAAGYAARTRLRSRSSHRTATWH